MANTVEILITAVDKASRTFSNVNASIKGLGDSQDSAALKSAGLAAKLSLVAMAVGAVVSFTKKAVDETVKYESEMDGLSRSLGIGIEETSKLVQASEYLTISQKDLTSALETAKGKGIDTSIAGIKALSTQYLQIQDPLARSTFLLETFGKAGGEMGKLLSKGADGIDDAMDSVRKSLVVTEEAQKQMLSYKQSTEGLKDAFQGLKITIGREVIPALDALFRALTPGKDEVEQNQEKINALNQELQALTRYGNMSGMSQYELMIRIRELQYQIGILNGTLDITPGKLGATGDAAEENAVKIWHFANGSWSLVAGLNSIPAQTDAYVTVHYSFEGIDSRDAAEWAVPMPDWNPDFLNPNAGRKGTGPKSKYEDAYGGWESARTPYLVGEKGPEIFVPASAGHIVPNNQIGGGGVEIDYERMARAFAEELQKVSR